MTIVASIRTKTKAIFLIEYRSPRFTLLYLKYQSRLIFVEVTVRRNATYNYLHEHLKVKFIKSICVSRIKYKLSSITLLDF